MIPPYTELHCTTLKSTTLHYTTLHYSTLKYTTLDYTLPCLSVVRQLGPPCPLLFADVIASPGATKSGLILRSYVGPLELK